MIRTLAQRYLSELDAHMRRVVDSMPAAPEFGVMLRYPLGWVNADGSANHQPTGKRIRPILLLLSTEATGGNRTAALPAAAAVELLHNFSLIHDDIQDDSSTRHGRPTVWMIWGRANAINVGDAMFALSYRALEGLDAYMPPDIVMKVYRIFTQTNLELTRGQHLDMRFERQRRVSADEYLSMISGKSAALVAACAQMGALIGSRDQDIARHFADFGLNLGIAFQIRDDILGIWGDPQVTGKSAATDILARKKSLPVIYGLEQDAELTALYEQEPFDSAQVERAVQLLNKAGALEYAQATETTYYQNALAALDRANPIGEAGEGLRQLAETLFQRAY
ncbi:MAG: polyprenyl synthetase family protein [Aggregatilineales bacterium]